MSAELFDDSASALALPAVDILPVKVGRKTKGSPEVEPAATPLLEASPQGWAAPAPHAPVNPWSGAPAEDALASYPPPGADQVPVHLPVPVEAGQPAGQPMVAPSLVPLPSTMEVPVEAEASKKFFGMSVRRPKKSDAPAEPVEVAAQAPSFSYEPPAPASAYEAVVAPVAAWPTDAGVSAVAGAEPTLAAGGHSAPAAYAPIDLFSAGPTGPADSAPTQAPVEAPVEAVVADPVAPPVADPVAAAVAVPVPEAPSAPVVDAAEVAALRAQLGASESARLAAENRADQAVAYAQQTQARLQQLESDGQARIQAAETKSRSAANEAQDWQIRHREAETTITELAASVAGAEKRMAELRAERDDLASSLAQATAPDQHVPTA